MGATCDAGDAFGDLHALRRGQPREARLHPPMLEERPRLDAQQVLSPALDLELDRLEDPRAHRAVGNSEDVETADSPIQGVGVRLREQPPAAATGAVLRGGFALAGHEAQPLALF